MKIARAGVVPKSLPRMQNFGFRCGREGREIREALQPFIIKRTDGADLRLLEHDFRDEDGVGILGFAPRQIAAVLGIPAEKAAAEGAGGSWTGQALSQTFNFQRSTSNVQFRTLLNVEAFASPARTVERWTLLS